MVYPYNISDKSKLYDIFFMITESDHINKKYNLYKRYKIKTLLIF